MKKKYVLLKDAPDLRKGAILEEDCEDGDQDYHCYDKKYIVAWTKEWGNNEWGVLYGREVVEAQPDWFEEICYVEVPKKHFAKVQKFVKTLK